MNPQNHPICFVASSARSRNVFPYTSWSRCSLASRIWSNFGDSGSRLFFRKISQKVCATALASVVFLSLLFSTLGFFVPVSAQTGGTDPTQAGFQLVPCDGVRVKCDYNQFIIGIQKIIKACIIFAVPLAAGVFGWFGFKLMMAGGDTKGREEAKAAMFKVLKGMLLMLGAWYVVDLALGGLLDPSFRSGLEQ